MIVYVSGPYSADSDEEIQDNCLIARKYALDIWNAGHYCVSPHMNTWRLEKQGCKAHYNDYLKLDFQLICICNAIFMLPNWEKSNGACKEKEFAEEIGLPVYYDLKDIGKYPEHLEELLPLYNKFWAKARTRIVMGAMQYGDDWRRKDNLKEILPEILDIPNYAALEYAKTERLIKLKEAL